MKTVLDKEKMPIVIFPNLAKHAINLFSSPEHSKYSEGAIVITHRSSVIVVRPSVVRSHFLVYTLASTNINQSAPNLVKIYMIIRSRRSPIMGLIGLEHLKLFPFELKKKKKLYIYFVYTLGSTNINRSALNFVKIYMTLRSRVSSIMGVIEPEQLELFALELLCFTLFTL